MSWLFRSEEKEVIIHSYDLLMIYNEYQMKKKVFAISGSARSESSSLAVIRSLRNSLHKNFDFDIFEELNSLPFFAPGLEVSLQVQNFLDRLNQADLFFIVTPEYIHAIPAVLKNALEWIVGDERFYQKKVAFVVASTSDGQYAKDSLREILKTMSADLSDGFEVSISGVQSRFTEDGELFPEISKVIEQKFKKHLL